MHPRECSQCLRLGASEFPLARVERASFYKANLVAFPAIQTYLVLGSSEICTVVTSCFFPVIVIFLQRSPEGSKTL